MDLREQLTNTLGNAYRIERELGGGGMSKVFLVEDLPLQRQVVVKVLSPSLAAGVNTDRFKRETLLAAQLQHPQIVPVLTAGEVGGLPFFVMPYVAGASLRDRLGAGTPLPVPEAVSVLRDVARALAYAHAAGVVHRDIKPDNVLLSEGSAAVTDFGIAKALSSARSEAPAETLTVAGTSLGTPLYMAPEQIAADPRVDHRADIYSFGVMAYELLTGRTPFHDHPRQSLITAHLTIAPAPVRDVAPDTPIGLAELVMRCLQKDPAARPQSARDLLDALDGLETTGTHSRAAARRRPSRLLIGGIAAAVLLVLAAGLAVRRPWAAASSPLDSRVVAVLPFRVASADPSLHYLQEGMMDLLAAKLTGEGGLRATEPRTVLDAWRRGGPGDGRDLSASQSAGIAERVGAGLMLLGDVVGTPNRVTLRGSLLRVPGGARIVQVSEEGPPDSLPWLIDRFAARLLSEAAGEGQQRVAGLTSTSLPALRAYLDGQALLRRGDAMSAARSFDRALEEDSAFALAGLGLHMATSWYGDPALSGRGLRAAWLARDRLSPRDRVLLDALAGPRYPELSSVREIFNARERYLQLAPDRAEAWYLVGDHIFHYGGVLGVANPPERAFEFFTRASELDSTYVVGYLHAHQLAVMLGDSAQERRLERLRFANDTSRHWHVGHRWYSAARKGDSVTIRALRDSLGDDYRTLAFAMIQQAFYDGTGAQEGWRAVRELVEQGSAPMPRQAANRQFLDIAMAFGKPGLAAQFIDQAYDSVADLNADILRVRNAMAGDGDTTLARAAAQRLAAFDARPTASDSMGRVWQRAVARAVEPWRISEGDTMHVRRTVERLRSFARVEGEERDSQRQAEIALIEAMYARTARSPNAGAAINRLDSLLAALPYYHSSIHHGRADFSNLVLARMLEERGDSRRALAAVRRRAAGMGGSAPYLPTMLREEGRLAEAVGERQLAIAAYRHYLALMFDPEPALEPSVRAAQEALSRLERAEGG